MKKSTRYEMRDTRYENGSALILAVVLTSLLAIVGVLFVMAARVDKIATSAISENKDLNFAVDTVITKISQELTLDVPGMPAQADPNDIEEYYDYPDSRNVWLASLEPYDPNADPNANDYRWHQISDVTGFLTKRGFQTQKVDVRPRNLSTTEVVREYPEITLDINGELVEQSADADGDGIADSKWIELDDITSSKGRPIFAAIRIIDNGGMLNVNTAYRFDPNQGLNKIDGSSQMQINLAGLARVGDNIGEIHTERCGLKSRTWDEFQNNMIWRIEFPDSGYWPFDIGDELELRYRYCITSKALTRLENTWNWTIGHGDGSNRPFWFKDEPYAGGSFGKLEEWQRAVTYPFDPNNYRRHLLTTCNMDRIINPLGQELYNGKMVNVNSDVVNLLYYAIRMGLYDAGIPDPNGLAAQMAVNIKDYSDNDSNVTPYNGCYGFERPCVYISELAYNSVTDANGQPHRSYAIELHKPYPDDGDPCGWQLVIDNPARKIPIDWSGTRQFHVVTWQNPDAPLVIGFNDPCDPNASANVINFSDVNAVFDDKSTIELWRPVGDVNIVVDSVPVPNWLVTDSNGIRSYQRDITLHKCIRRLWAGTTEPNSTLGSMNTYKKNGDSIYIQAHPTNLRFTNIGEIGMVFRKSAYSQGPDPIGRDDTEATARLNLADPIFQQIFNYLTVFDPTVDGIDNNGDGYGLGATLDPNELKIPGRININTAPWFVIAQLPWVSPELAQAVVAYRDKLKLWDGVVVDYSDDRDRGRTRGRARGMWELVDQPPPPISVRREALGFANVGELINVTHDLAGKGGFSYNQWYDIRRYGRGNGDQRGFPDLTTNPPRTGIDGAPDDFEERDLIFARISNLVTVRSDVFTAYILVRIGVDGPQKRVIAILDRSDVYPDGKGGVIGRVKVRAVQPVPDPR